MECLRHTATKFGALDATFNCPQIANPMADKNDTTLFNGNSIFEKPNIVELFNENLKGRGNDVSPFLDLIPIVNSDALQRSTCSNLKAVKLQTTQKFKNLSKSGVASFQCPRHFIIHYFVDLTGGEKYVIVIHY